MHGNEYTQCELSSLLLVSSDNLLYLSSGITIVLYSLLTLVFPTGHKASWFHAVVLLYVQQCSGRIYGSAQV